MSDEIGGRSGKCAKILCISCTGPSSSHEEVCVPRPKNEASFAE